MIVSVAELSVFLGIATPTPASQVEALMLTAITMAEEAIRNFLDIVYLEAPATPVSIDVPYNGSGTQFLHLNFWVRSLTKVEAVDEEDEVTELEGVKLWPPNPQMRTANALPLYSELKYASTWGSLYSIYRITGNFGIPKADMPATILAAIKFTAKHYFDLLQLDATVQSQSGASISTIAANNVTELPNHVKSLLQPYKWIRVD